jgi:hypothetical protein
VSIVGIFHEFREGIGVRDVADQVLATAPGSFDLDNQLAKGSFAASHADDVSAVTGQSQRDGATDPSAGSGDDGNSLVDWCAPVVLPP